MIDDAISSAWPCCTLERLVAYDSVLGMFGRAQRYSLGDVRMLLEGSYAGTSTSSSLLVEGVVLPVFEH